jgi:hypothetical protein
VPLGSLVRPLTSARRRTRRSGSLAGVALVGVAGLALVATGCDRATEPRSLVVVEVTGGAAVASLVRIDVDVHGVRWAHAGDAPQKIGIYVPATVKGLVVVIVEGIGAAGVPVARGTGMTTVQPGAVSMVQRSRAGAPLASFASFASFVSWGSRPAGWLPLFDAEGLERAGSTSSFTSAEP